MIVPPSFVPCSFCGDQALLPGRPDTYRYAGRPCCKECHEELTQGKIPKVTGRDSGGYGGPCEDDGGPWQQNAARQLEDG